MKSTEYCKKWSETGESNPAELDPKSSASADRLVSDMVRPLRVERSFLAFQASTLTTSVTAALSLSVLLFVLCLPICVCTTTFDTVAIVGFVAL